MYAWEKMFQQTALEKGKMKYSQLFLDEENEVNELCLRIDEISLSYQSITSRIKYEVKTRLEVEKEQFIMKEIKRLQENHKDDKLKYLYYDCLKNLQCF